jgi:DnaK suppressor protein
MTVSATATVRSPEPLPRSRSRGGSGAGSSDQPPFSLKVPAGGPGRRNPRTAKPLADVAIADFLAVARSALTAKRKFRIHQLRQLNATCPHPSADPARAEIHRALQVAARSALRDIDSALGRIRQGSYGRCPRCGETISVHRLRALPMTLLCGRCQRATAGRTGGEPGHTSTGSRLLHGSGVIRPLRTVPDTTRAGRREENTIVTTDLKPAGSGVPAGPPRATPRDVEAATS